MRKNKDQRTFLTSYWYDRNMRKLDVLTVVAVLVLATVNGSIWLHLQVVALLAEQSGHNPFQLRLWRDKIKKRDAPQDKPTFNIRLHPKCIASRFSFMSKEEFGVWGLIFHDYTVYH